MDDVSTIEFDLPAPASRQSLYAFGLHKAGSTLLERCVAEMAEAAGVPVVNLPGQAFSKGFAAKSLSRDQIGPILLRDGYAFVGFRALNGAVPLDQLTERRKVLLVRDPRDMLVSLYFSLRQSHVLPSGGPMREQALSARSAAAAVSIEEFVLSDISNRLARGYREYMPHIDETWLVHRYEDIIYDKAAWLGEMNAHLRLGVSGDDLLRIAGQNHLIPAAEDRGAHVRQVHPGNHRAHLSAAVIEKVDGLFSDVMRRFGYGQGFARR